MRGQCDDRWTQFRLVNWLNLLVLGNDAVVGRVELHVADSSPVLGHAVLAPIELKLNLKRKPER